MIDHIDQTFVDTVIAFAAVRFPVGEAAVGAVKTESGRILTSVYVEAAVDTANLCSETGAICEAHKLGERIVATICIYRETPESLFRIIPPCGICQERRAFHWHYETPVVKVLMLVDAPALLVGGIVFAVPNIGLALLSLQAQSYLAAFVWIVFGSAQWWLVGAYLKSKLNQRPAN